MEVFQRALAAGLFALGTTVAMAQTPFPSEALKSASSLAGAFSALGIGVPQVSGYLLLDAPEVSGPGKVKAKASSEIPGTTYLILLHGTPDRPTALAPSAPPAAEPKKRQREAPQAPPALPTALVAAEKFTPTAKATISAEFNVADTQWVTLVAFAQGRWFMTAREIKVGKLR